MDHSAAASIFPLELPDAVMLATVLEDLDGSEAVFVNRNRKDFNDPDIHSELGSQLGSERCSERFATTSEVS